MRHIFRKWLTGGAAVLTLMAGLFGFALPQDCRAAQDYAVVAAADLPREARETLLLIKAGDPFPYAKDGVVFGNYERILPRQKRGYYTDYTVRTPGVKSRGARRIVAGKGRTGDPATSGEYWYTADHYRSFARIAE
ncbi:MAG: ribonuclease domain-containing protein [Sutterella sp.]